ncbi:c-type cytochrome [Sinorhizobium meliloti]|uniref:c-type cytochrome n=1 Tax=Rhizobium meliloti TaxID=382 RepID=UPI001F30A2D3|nr:cytochrome c family protein [Sinorhizobium meliloti]
MICNTIHATAAPASNRIKEQVGALRTTLFLLLDGSIRCRLPLRGQKDSVCCGNVASPATAPGRDSKMGPLLFGIIGQTAGSVEGANYSDTMRSSRITWDRQSLDTFLAAPRQLVRGTRMTVRVPEAAQRIAIIDYLESRSLD